MEWTPMSELNIRKDPCELDFLSLGALVHRLDPGVIPFRKAQSFEIHVSGGEYNVAAGLADCFGLKTGIATAMVNYPIGEIVQRRVREMGVTPFYKWFEHDGVRGPNIATVYSDRGYGVRPPVVFYNRSNEAGAMLKPGDFNWAEIFGRGVRWFHSGGIFASLSETTAPLIIEAMKAAQASGAITSFDLNYRAKLWAAVGGPEHGQQLIKRITNHLDALIGNEEDLQKGLGVPGPDVASKSSLDPDTFFVLIDRVIERHPNIKLVATTLREVRSTNRHDWAAVLWLDGKRYVSPMRELDVLDRIGGGDGFASGLIYGLLSGRPPEDALRLGWAHGALLTTFPGDVTMAKLPEVEALAKGGSARVQR
jgi:2-dehydro-3-deoxygluconokinase